MEDAPEMDAWVTAEKQANPERFAAMAVPTTPPAAGVVTTGGNAAQADLDKRLASTDLEVREAAINEATALRKNGQL